MLSYSILRSVCLGALSVGLLAAEDGFQPLFDGKSLEGWKSAHSKGEGDWGPFRVNEVEKAIHVYKGEEAGSKQSSDCLNTEKEYSHFTLRLEYKWLENRFEPRADHDRDAGLLFHVHGNLTKVWPLSMEMQIGETPGGRFGAKRYHTGDLFVLGGNLRCKTTKTKGRYDPDGKLEAGRHCATPLGVEKPKGEWNEMEIVVEGARKAVFKLNGVVVHEIQDLEMKIDDKWVPLSKGRIGIQAEWAELLYRNIRIKEHKQGE
ncbi:DUF1080 domain-containing protein [Verrucomicrobiaceae bacterium 227]